MKKFQALFLGISMLTVLLFSSCSVFAFSPQNNFILRNSKRNPTKSLVRPSVVDNSAAYQNEGKNGTSWEDAYIIDSKEDFITLRDRVNSGSEDVGKYYKLAVDIDLSSETQWIGIGSGSGRDIVSIDNDGNFIRYTYATSNDVPVPVASADPYVPSASSDLVYYEYYDYNFSGHFDGQNHTITVKIDNGYFIANLFNRVYEGEIRNLNVNGDVSGLETGGIVRLLEASTMENCTFTGNVTGLRGAGGIIYKMDSSYSYDANGDFNFNNSVVKNCSFSGNVFVPENNDYLLNVMVSSDGTLQQDSYFRSATPIFIYPDRYITIASFAGGIVALLSSGGYSVVNNCSVLANSTISNKNKATTVSIPPEVYSNYESLSVDVEHCAGGIAGFIQGDAIIVYDANSGLVSLDEICYVNITDCRTEATITDAKYIGGIAGAVGDYYHLENNIWDSSYPEVGIYLSNEGTTSKARSYSKWSDNFALTAELVNSIAGALGVNASDVRKFSDEEILSDSWTLSSEDNSEIINNNQRVVFSLPETRVSTNGVYVLKLDIGGDIAVSEDIDLVNIIVGANDNGGNVVPAALGNFECVFLDESYNVISSVPESKSVYVAMVLTAGQTNRAVITAEGLPVTFIETVTQEELLKEGFLDNVAALLSSNDSNTTVISSEIEPLPESAIQDPAEPTEEVSQYAKEQNYELVYKMNNISVDNAGYYIFKVNVPEEFVSQDVKNFKVFVMFDQEGTVKKSNLLGSIFTLIDGNGSGLFDGMPMPAQLFVAGFFPIGQSVFLGLGKMLLKLLMLLAGCEVGFGIAGGTLILVGGLAVVKFFKRKK